MNNKTQSYTSAGVFPAKLIRRLHECIVDNAVVPYHIQMSITNLCNLNCGFCSCANRKDDKEMSMVTAHSLLSRFALLGAKAVTITGGGEPTLHPHIGDIVEHAKRVGLHVGLVSNGIDIYKLSRDTLPMLDWLRISVSDDRDLEQLFSHVGKAHKETKGQKDWAFSYVLTVNADFEKLARVLTFAKEHNFTHVRVVSDLLDLENVPRMENVKSLMRDMGVDDSLAIYQGRKDSVRGAKRCWISLLKPVISTDGKVYPCCGVQYAQEVPSLDFNDSMQMGDAFSFLDLCKFQQPFDGSNCVRCYYDEYNKAIETAIVPLEHEEFI